MSNIRLRWNLPPVSSRQRPIDYTRIEIRVSDEVPWTEQDRVNPENTQELVFQDVAPGTYQYRATVVDVDGRESDPVTTEASIAFDPPGAVTDLIATVE